MTPAAANAPLRDSRPENDKAARHPHASPPDTPPMLPRTQRSEDPGPSRPRGRIVVRPSHGHLISRAARPSGEACFPSATETASKSYLCSPVLGYAPDLASTTPSPRRPRRHRTTPLRPTPLPRHHTGPADNAAPHSENEHP